MACYVTYWPADWVQTILKNKDEGPLTVLYGGEHRSQPQFGKVTIGDTVFPVTLSNGRLFVLGRMTITEMQNADAYANQYIEKEHKVKSDTYMWDSYSLKNKDSITHYIPRTCVDDAALGTDGTAITMRPVPADQIPMIKLGPKPGSEQPLKMRDGKISINNFSGYFRRLSEDSVRIFNAVIDQRADKDNL